MGKIGHQSMLVDPSTPEAFVALPMTAIKLDVLRKCFLG